MVSGGLLRADKSIAAPARRHLRRSKAIAAQLKEEDLKRIWDDTEIKSITPHTIISFSDFLKNWMMYA